MSKDILWQVLPSGRENAMNATNLRILANENGANIEPGNTEEPTRDLLREMIVDDGLLVGSYRRGFFRIVEVEDLNITLNHLQARIQGTQDRINALQNSWDQENG